LLPMHTRTELGETLIQEMRERPPQDWESWCLSRIGARGLFYGPANQVLPAATVTRWVEAVLKTPGAGEAIAAMARRTGDATRDLAPMTLEMVRRSLAEQPKAEALLAIFEGSERRDLRALGRIFGEELPSGLVLEGE